MYRIGRNFNFCVGNQCLNFGKSLYRDMCNNVTDSRTCNVIPTILNRIPFLKGNLIDVQLFEKHRRVLELPTPDLRIKFPNSICRDEVFDIPKYSNIIQAPSQSTIKGEIQAARLVVIRRRKMKKHKLKKLRKKMKFEWAKVRQRREMRKEKSFQAELIAKIREADKFSAENYVYQKLKEANEIHIPRFWKGKRLPQFIIKQKLGLK